MRLSKLVQNKRSNQTNIARINIYDYTKLIIVLRTAVEKGEVTLDEATSHDDLFDAFRLKSRVFVDLIY